MAQRSDPFFNVRLNAEQLLVELKIDTLPIDPFDIARRLDIELRPMPSNAGGASGMLIHVSGQFGIAYPTHIENIGFKNFSVGHEIGHYRIEGHIDAIVDDNGRHVSHAGFCSKDRYEQEADHFAATLLMPIKLFVAAMKRAGDGLSAITALAEKCKTSLEATAIRFAETNPNPVAVIRSEDQTIDYAFMSESLRDFSDLEWIHKGTLLPSNSITADFNANKNKTKNAGRTNGTSNLQDWFNGPHMQEVIEEVVGLGSYGKTLTVLTGMEPPDEAEDNENDLEESWDIRFHR